jgi:hypothetical protein
MDESMRIVVVGAVVGLLVIVAVYRYITQRRQLSSGRVIGRFLPQKSAGKFIIENPITITTAGKWCRLLLTLKSAEAYTIQHSPKYFFEKVALLVGTPYTLTMKDAQNHVVHTETGSLGPFVAWLGSRHGGAETMLGERSSGSHQGAVTLLEFLPGEAGPYMLSLHITDNVETECSGSSSTWEVLEVELSVMENVTPLSKTVSYPHKRIRI